MWSLVDSGSSTHAVNAKQIFPNAPVEPPPKGHQGFKVANGGRIEHKGFVTTTVKMQEGDERVVKWKNTDVDFPILSTHELARNGHKLDYDEDEGHIINKTTGHTNKFMHAKGVDSTLMHFPKRLFHANASGAGFVWPA